MARGRKNSPLLGHEAGDLNEALRALPTLPPVEPVETEPQPEPALKPDPATPEELTATPPPESPAPTKRATKKKTSTKKPSSRSKPKPTKSSAAGSTEIVTTVPHGTKQILARLRDETGESYGDVVCRLFGTYYQRLKSEAAAPDGPTADNPFAPSGTKKRNLAPTADAKAPLSLWVESSQAEAISNLRHETNLSLPKLLVMVTEWNDADRDNPPRQP